MSTSKAGLKKGLIRATFIVEERHLDFIKKVAFIRKQSIKDFMYSMLEREYNRITLSHKNMDKEINSLD